MILLWYTIILGDVNYYTPSPLQNPEGKIHKSPLILIWKKVSCTNIVTRMPGFWSKLLSYIQVSCTMGFVWVYGLYTLPRGYNLPALSTCTLCRGYRCIIFISELLAFYYLALPCFLSVFNKMINPGTCRGSAWLYIWCSNITTVYRAHSS